MSRRCSPQLAAKFNDTELGGSTVLVHVDATSESFLQLCEIEYRVEAESLISLMINSIERVHSLNGDDTTTVASPKCLS